ncbi:PTS sugar transporter subunit IIA [Bacillus niameyensis]|uniref:PTS sugar transporter subunit IIA n=1 Tax=Bacillus niameyensis TaxID=1522308 RepID=UPI000783F9E9|nr:hypothetical protein [Bacillus niameyensis]
MISILIVTHGQLAKTLLETSQLFVSNPSDVDYVCFSPDQGVEDLKEIVLQKISMLNDATNILCLVDIPSGSPARVIGELVLTNPKVELITGVNLPILIEAMLARELYPIEELVHHLIHSSRESIVDIGSILRNESFN